MNEKIQVSPEVSPTRQFVNLEPRPQATAEARRLGLVPVPSKSKTLRTLRKVFPGARFQSVTESGKQSVQLFYRPRAGGEDAPINNVEIPPNGTEAGACQALLCAAFRVYGMEARWDPKFPGTYRLSPIKDYQGTEKQLPIELDPEVPVDVEALGSALADRQNGKTTAEESNAAIVASIGKEPTEFSCKDCGAEPGCNIDCARCLSK